MTATDNLRVLREQALRARSERMAASLGGVQRGMDAERLAPLQRMIGRIDAALGLEKRPAAPPKRG